MTTKTEAKKTAKKTVPLLTTDQRRKVREKMVDEGFTRAEAVAWVLHFEP